MAYYAKGKEHHMYGKKHTEEAKRKIRLARAKQVITEESNDKRREKLKGRKFSKESIEKMKQHALRRFSKKENHPHFGKPRTDEAKKNIRKALEGGKLEDYHTPERVEEIRAKIKEARSKQVLPVKDTSIEIKLQGFLKQLGLEFYTHQYMKIEHAYQCDILVPSLNLVIEADGVYWHNYPLGNEVDIKRTQELLDAGFRVLRFWGSEIKHITLPEFERKVEQVSDYESSTTTWN